MPLDVEFSRNWNCTAEERSKTEAESWCADIQCFNGNCTQKTISAVFHIIAGSCHCDPGWIGESCDKCCDLPCVEDRGRCEIHYSERLPFCNCYKQNNSTGLFCEEAKNVTEPNITYYYSVSEVHKAAWELPVIISAALVIILAVSIYTTLYTMYRHRHPWLVKVIMKYHSMYFKDSDRTYDAYLSYCTENDDDRKFVVTSLLPFLEKEGYMVCIDQRDFILGTAQVDSIAEAITKSRRSILVLSPDYVTSEWQEFESQCAIKESLRNDHSIIPIIFKPLTDVKEQISPSLKHIIDFITCIKWPDGYQQKKEKAKAGTESSKHQIETDTQAKEKKENAEKESGSGKNQLKTDTQETKISREEKRFWARLLLALPKLDKAKDVNENSIENGVDSVKRKQSTPNNSLDNYEMLQISLNENSNLFNRRHFDNVLAIHKAKNVQIVPSDPEQPPNLEESFDHTY